MNYHYLHFDEINSTNDYLKNSYKLLNDLTFVSAGYQSHGKGRNDRLWVSEPNKNLMLSLLIKNQNIINKFSSLSIFAAVAIAKLLESYQVKNISIKWPNDVFVGDKKVCGILLEGQVPEYVIMGVGLNVNQKIFPNNLRRPATSLSLELKKELNIEEIKEKLFGDIVKDLLDYQENRYLEYFKEHNYLLNKRVRVIVNDHPFIGEVVGIDDNFFLQVRTSDMLLHIDSGEIEIL